VALIAGVIITEARPVYGYLRSATFGDPSDPTEMFIGFGLAALLCLGATVLPIRFAMSRLEKIER